MGELRYIDAVREDRTLVARLEEIYQDMYKIKRFRKRLEEIDNEVGWYVGKQAFQYLPDYDGYYEYAFAHYVPNQDKYIVVEEVLDILKDKGANDIPGYIYCLLIMAHYQPIMEEKYEKCRGRMDELDKSEVAEFNIVRNRVKLTAGFLEKLDYQVPKFIRSIEN